MVSNPIFMSETMQDYIITEIHDNGGTWSIYLTETEKYIERLDTYEKYLKQHDLDEWLGGE